MNRKPAAVCLFALVTLCFAMIGRTSARAADVAAPIITPFRSEALRAFQELSRKGLRVFTFGQLKPSTIEMLVPSEFLNKPIDGRTLVEAIAAKHALKVSWLHDGKSVVLYNGSSDAEVERLRSELASADTTVRQNAVMRSPSLNDIRTIPMLIDFAKGKDAESRLLALNSLYADDSGLEVALAVDDRMLDLLATALESRDTVWDAARALWSIGGQKVTPSMEKLLNDPDRRLKAFNAFMLGRRGGEKALSLMRSQGDNSSDTASPKPWIGIDFESDMAGMRRETVLPAITKALAGQDKIAREFAVQALGVVATEEDLPLLKLSLDDSNGIVRYQAANSILKLGGEQAWGLLERALERQTARGDIFAALREWGGERARALLEKNLDRVVILKGPEQWAELETLGFIGSDKALRRLETAWAGPGPDVDAWVMDSMHATIVGALARMGGEKIVPMLEVALDNKAARTPAIVALGSARGDKALALLEGVVEKGEPAECAAALNSLKRIGTDAACVLLKKALHHPNAPSRGYAALALAGCVPDQSIQYLAMALDDPEAMIRQAAILELRHQSVDKALPLLKKGLADANEEVYNISAEILTEIGGDDALAILEDRLHSADAQVRSTIAFQLSSNRGREPRAIALLVSLLKDYDVVRYGGTVRQHAAQILSEKGGKQAAAALEKMLADPEAHMRAMAATAQATLGCAEAAVKLEPLLRDADDDVRKIAASAQWKLGGEKAAALLETFLADPNPSMRAHAVASISHDNETTRRQLAKALADPDSTVRIAAVNVLKTLRNDWSLEQLGEAFKDERVRLETVDALSEFDHETATALLEKAIADANVEVRKHAFFALLNFGGENVCGKLGEALVNEHDEKLKELMVRAVDQRFPDVSAIRDALEKLKHPAPAPELRKPTAPPDLQF